MTVKCDLTMNAMAIDVETGELIDPYDGQAGPGSPGDQMKPELKTIRKIGQ